MKIRTVLNRLTTTMANNKAFAAALVSILILSGAIQAEDTATWTNIVTAVAALASAAL